MTSTAYPQTNPYSSSGIPQPQGGGAPVPDSYFTESRKGEVNELRNLLRNFSTERDMKKKRDIIKKVIAYMTLGIDVSRLLTEMMLVIETRDLVIKKMVYLFLSNYATANPELAQMCTNTLTKDCHNEDPMVRGLALRSLCSLRLPQMVEYVSEPLHRALQDSHAYVRKTAVMGILKMYHLDQDILEQNHFVDTLYDMLRDPDAAVVTNCILVLNEIMAKTGGMAINRAIMLHLLNRLAEFGEFGVLAVLDLVPRYIPANEEEGYQIMNLLDPLLRTTNAGAFMAVIFAFLSLAQNLTADGIQRQIVMRVKAPVITMMTGGSSELMYCLLKHVDALIELCPGVFDDEYRQFYLRYHEPTSVKYLKIQILAKITNPSNAPDIVGELSECVANTDTTLSRLSVRSLARIACRDVGGEGCAENITCRLVEMVDLDISHVSSEAATALSAILRKHPDLKELIAPPLPRALKYMSESSGKASIIYLLGECGDIVSEAPYCLEKLIDSYDKIQSSLVKIALLTSTMKLFFQRPPEVQKMLGRLLKKATEDVSCQDLHDRALLYYRLLRTATDPMIVQNVIKTKTAIPGNCNFSEENFDDDIRDELMKEFNTLSIIYGTTSDNFIAEENLVKFVKMPAEHPLDGPSPAIHRSEDDAVRHVTHQVQQTSIADSTVSQVPAAEPHGAPEMDLLGFGAEPTPAPVIAPHSFRLIPNVALTGDEYQTKWSAVQDADSHVIIVPLSTQPGSTDDVERLLEEAFIKTMASGELPTEFKFFLYAQEVPPTGSILLVQASIAKNVSPCEMLLTIKVSGPGGLEKVEAFVNILKNALSPYV
jgi:vesicle coat complex subunit